MVGVAALKIMDSWYKLCNYGVKNAKEKKKEKKMNLCKLHMGNIVEEPFLDICFWVPVMFKQC